MARDTDSGDLQDDRGLELPERRFPQMAGAMGFRRVAVVVVAIVVGIIVLASVHGASTPVSSSQSTAARHGAPPATTAAPHGVTTTLPTHPASQVKVQVANGTQVSLAATKWSAAVGAKLGYQMLSPADTAAVGSSTIYDATGYLGDAQALAKAIKDPTITIAPIASAPQTSPGGSPDLLLVLGPPLAQELGLPVSQG